MTTGCCALAELRQCRYVISLMAGALQAQTNYVYQFMMAAVNLCRSPPRHTSFMPSTLV